MYGWTDRQIHRQIDGLTGGRMDGWMDGWTDRQDRCRHVQTNRQTYRKMDGWKHLFKGLLSKLMRLEVTVKVD